MGGIRGARRRAVAAVIVCSTIGLGVVATQSQAVATPNVVRLHLGSDGARSFSYGTTVQALTPGKNSCALTGAQNVMLLSSTPTPQSAPGVANDGLGVKASPSSANGTPCSQTDAAETLRLQAGPALGGRTFSAVRFDIEMTGNAIVKLTLSNSTSSRDFFLQTGTSITPVEAAEMNPVGPPYTVVTDAADPVDACAAPNSSGPNSNQSDNCLWTVNPGFDFTSVVLTTTVGTVSLEGSADFGNNPDFDSLFYLSNAAPVATPDSVAVDEDGTVTFDVRANDIDADGDLLTATATSQPTKGALVQGADGRFTYTPFANLNGADSFTYRVSDGNNSSETTVDITITPVNDAPSALSSSQTTAEDTSTTVTVATDIDSTVVNAACTTTNGTTTNGGNGTITFTPAPDFNGAAQATCSITDDGGVSSPTSAVVTFSVTPTNDQPIAVDDAFDVAEATATTLDVTANDTDVDGDPLAATAVTDPPHGTASVTPGGDVLYTPDSGYLGSDSFTYTVGDGGGGSDTATVTIDVYPVICSAQTVTDTDGAVTGTFTRLSDPQVCKRYVLEANAADGTILFTPQGAFDVKYRGVVTFGPKPAPVGTLNLLLRYDPTGGTTFQPVQWCNDPVFDGNGDVTDATLPGVGQTWCIASETTVAVGTAQVQTSWQVFGIDDPRFQ
jgi:Bacterial Ig domain